MVGKGRSGEESLEALRARLRPSDGDSGGWGEISSQSGSTPSSDGLDGWGDFTSSSWSNGAEIGADGAGTGGWGLEDAGPGSSGILDRRAPATAQVHASTRPVSARSSRATWGAFAAVVIGGVGLGVALHMLLAGIDIVGWMLEGAALYSRIAIAAVVVLAVLSFVGLVLAIVGLVRSQRRMWAVTALVAAIVLPPCSGALGISSGVTAFKERTISDVRLYASQLSPERVEGVYAAFEERGITLPAEDEVLSILEQSQGVLEDDDAGDSGEQPSPGDADDQSEGDGEG